MCPKWPTKAKAERSKQHSALAFSTVGAKDGRLGGKLRTRSYDSG
jgi:hypothetical protein